MEPHLYLVHVGFYDQATSGGGVYESHTNFFLVAQSAEAARAKAKSLELFKDKKMHIDGIQEVKAVDGYRLALTKDETLSGKSEINPYVFRDLMPPKAGVAKDIQSA